MERDILFVLPPGFIDNNRREYCPECAEMSGLLAYFPAIKDALDIRHVGIDHPRHTITAVLGNGAFNAPTLVLAAKTILPPEIDFGVANGRTYLDSIRTISALFAQRYGTPVRRGS